MKIYQVVFTLDVDFDKELDIHGEDLAEIITDMAIDKLVYGGCDSDSVTTITEVQDNG